MTYTAGQIPNYSPISAIDRANDLLEIVDISGNATFNVTPNNLMGITTGAAVSTTMTQTIQNKTFDATNIFTPSDTNWTMQDNADATKQMQFQLSGLTTGNTRVLTVPDRSSTIATLGGNQTFTGNNSFTGSSWSGGTIDNATVTVDAVSGHTSSNTGTIYGVSVTAGKFAGSSISNGTVGPSQLGTGATSNTVSTLQTTNSVTFTDLSTAGPAVTVTIGNNGLALVSVSAQTFTGTNTDGTFMGFAVSGANTIAASTTQSMFFQAATASGSAIRASYCALLTGLTAGSTTFTAKYRSLSGNTGSWEDRVISVVPL